LRSEFGIEPRRWVKMPDDVHQAVDTLVDRIASAPRPRAAKSQLGGSNAS
jgi:hypothetical protein